MHCTDTNVTPFGIAAFGNFLYWTEAQTGRVNQLNLITLVEAPLASLDGVGHLTIVRMTELVNRGRY